MVRRHTAPRNRRVGVTLLEVLVAIFIATIGLISLTTLFPIRLQMMAQAIQDSRDPQLASFADALQQVGDDIIASSQMALGDLLQRDISQAQAHCERFAAHDGQMEKLLQSLRQLGPNLQHPSDRQVLERTVQFLKKWQRDVRKVKGTLALLAEAAQQQSQGANREPKKEDILLFSRGRIHTSRIDVTSSVW